MLQKQVKKYNKKKAGYTITALVYYLNEPKPWSAMRLYTQYPALKAEYRLRNFGSDLELVFV